MKIARGFKENPLTVKVKVQEFNSLNDAKLHLSEDELLARINYGHRLFTLNAERRQYVTKLVVDKVR